MKKGTTELLKFKKLARRLDLRVWQCTGLLESLWQFTITNAKTGDIGQHSNEDIAAGLDWMDDADDLISALLACGWLDEHSTHRLVVHDWSDHAPNFIKGHVKAKSLTFADESESSSPPLSGGGSIEGGSSTPKQGLEGGSSTVHPPSKTPPTKPIQAKPIQAKPIQRGESSSPPLSSKRFQRPTVDQVAEYIRDRGSTVDAEAFVDYYESVGWRVGRTNKPMKDWKSAVRQWERSDKEGRNDGTKQAVGSVARIRSNDEFEFEGEVIDRTIDADVPF